MIEGEVEAELTGNNNKNYDDTTWFRCFKGHKLVVMMYVSVNIVVQFSGV